jgi:NADH-quinone oxidoreductase subunit N
MTTADLPALIPVIVLLVGAAIVTATARLWRADAFVAPLIGIASALAAASAASFAGVGHDPFGGAIRRDSATLFFSVLASTSTAAAIAIGLRRAAALTVALVLVSCAGALVTIASGDLGVLVLGVMLLILPVAFAQTRRGVAALAAAGLVAVGAVDLALATGSTSLPALDLVASPLGLAGVALMIAGLSVIAGIVTLRSRATRDDATYDTYVTVVVSTAGIAALLRVGAALAPFALVDWRASVAVLAAIAVVVASFVAIGQMAVRRILAHASIAQSGYAAISLTAGFASGPTAAFFLGVFALMTIGAFALVAQLPSNVRLHDLRGLARRRPLFVAALGALLLGLAGLPPTVGFLAKLYVLELAVGAQLAWLAIIAALASVLSAVAYLRILFACLGEGEGAPLRGRVNAIGLLAAVAVLLLGVVPGPLLSVVQNVRF